MWIFSGDDFWISFHIQRTCFFQFTGTLLADPAFDSRPALFVAVYSALLGPL